MTGGSSVFDSYVIMSKTLEGRDKMTKVVQYGARFLSWYFRSRQSLELSDKADRLYKTTQLSRKAFRLMKLLDEVHKLRTAIKAANKFQDPDFLLPSLRSVAMAIFWTSDNLNYLSSTGTVSFGRMRAMKGFSRSWCIASLALIMIGMRSIFHAKAMHLEERSAERPQASFLALESQQNEAKLLEGWMTVAKGTADLICAVNMPGVDLPKKIMGAPLNDGIIGASGVISALLVIRSVWPSTV